MNKLYFLLIGLLLSQQNLTFNYEGKYGNGINVKEVGENPDSTNYNYFENLLDINFNYKNLFLHTQLEYSNSPIYGYDKTKIKDLANTYFIEYSNSELIIKYGHIQSLYGYGLSFNIFQDQTTDFDNRIKGIELKYSPYDIVDFFYIRGSGNYGMKSTGSLRYNDLSFNHSLDYYGTQFYTSLGDFLISFSNQKTKYPEGLLLDFSLNRPFMQSDTRLSHDLVNFSFTEPFDSLANIDTEVKLSGLNLSYSNTLSIFDIYIEKSINTYNKILRESENVDGSYDYISIASSIFDINFLYEFKNYNMLYYMPITSNPPLGFMESNSVLMSRIQHNINFSDEIGHQLETRFYIKNTEFIFNLSMGMKHSGIADPLSFNFDENGNAVYEYYYAKPSFSDFITLGDMNFLDKDFVYHKPFRDFYAEFNGWNSNNNFYYKVGFASHISYNNKDAKNYRAYTIPTQFVYGFKNNNSLTVYFEKQHISNIFSTNNWTDYYEDSEYNNYYVSLSYHINKIGSLTYFYDEESKNSNSNNWEGIELNLELSSSSQISIFKGSQKGGLICANGICAIQPSFQDGIKVTLRTLF